MSKTKYKPLFSRVVIEREVQTKVGSVMLPEHLQKKHARCEGVVIAIGPTADGVKIGDKVIFGRHSGTWLDGSYSQVAVQTQQGQQRALKDNDDGTLFLCQDEDLLAIIEE